MMQLFNFIACRKIHEERNIFSGILSNKLFIVIVVSILGLQGILITFGGEGLHVYNNYGLTIEQWLISLGIGSIALPINFILKQFPVSEDEPNETHSECEDAIEVGGVELAKGNFEGQTEIKMIKVQRISGISENRPINSIGSSTYPDAYNFF
jgi:P-type Ca2+ transporter type 2B